MTGGSRAGVRPAGRAEAEGRLRRYSREQADVVSRAQAVACGLSARQVDWMVRSGRWDRLRPGVFVTHRGPVGDDARVWAALLSAGAGAVAGGRTALWLWGVLDAAPSVLTVCVPHHRTVGRLPGVVVTRRRGLEDLRHPVVTPPRLRVEEAVLDVADTAGRVQEALDVVLGAAQRRVSTADRLRDALGSRPRHSRRRLVEAVLADVIVGVRSALEREYLRGVERPHGLPPGRYNPVERVVERGGERVRYRDVHYDEWALVVELDGAQAHPADRRHVDDARDNAVTVSGRGTLRYGWREVAGEPCAVAAEVAAALQVRGWPGRARGCGAGCPLG